MPAGRPEIPIDVKDVERLASRGLNEQQIADALGINIKTLAQRKEKYRDFAEALKKGKARGVSEVANHLFQASEEGNVTASIFFLKSRAEWRENTNISIGGNGTPVESKIVVEFVDSKE